MFCKNCGSKMPEAGKFCGDCGCPTNGIVPAPPKPISRGISCPVCRSKDLQAIVGSNVSGGGFSASKGCLGFLFFGPLGLLCGACGSKISTKNKTFWVCKNCGNKFRNRQEQLTEQMHEAKHQYKVSLGLGIVFAFFTVLIFIQYLKIRLNDSVPADVQILPMFFTVLFFAILFLVSAAVYSNKYYKAKNEYNKIYNARRR